MEVDDYFVRIVPQSAYFNLNLKDNFNSLFGKVIIKLRHFFNWLILGTRAPPREIAYDNSLLQHEDSYPTAPRVGTPPRTLTLDKYPFPGVEDFEEPVKDHNQIVRPKSTIPYKIEDALNDTRIIHRESTPPIGASGDGLTTSEEVVHLRRQMAKLNRRVMALELENLNRLQKEKILYGLGIAYFLLKAIVWLNRNY